MAPRRIPRAFAWRGGVSIEGTPITCDAAGPPGGLVFLAHARAPAAASRGPRSLRGGGRRELLATEETLALLGRAGEPLRARALPARFARAFTLGDLRLEVVPSGYLPGAASLLVEHGERRVLYAGAVLRDAPAFGAEPCVVRRADAVCLDARGAAVTLPARADALADACRFVEETLVARGAPVLLVEPFAGAMDVAAALGRAGFVLRGHRSVVAAAVAYRNAGAAAPLVGRFDRRLGAREALLWPADAQDAPLLGVLAAARFAHVPLATEASRDDLLAYVEATGAREVALVGDRGDLLGAELRARGLDAYALGPPRQMELIAPLHAAAPAVDARA